MGIWRPNCISSTRCLLIIENTQEKLAEIREKVHRTSIYISTNLREEDKTRFKQLSDSQFNGDYALCLRWLLDCAEGLFFKPEHGLQEAIENLVEEVEKIKENIKQLTEKPQEEFREIKMADGRVIKRKI